MTNKRNAQENLDEQIADFERKNPKIAEALRVFDISVEQYSRTVQTPKVYHSASTTLQRTDAHDNSQKHR